MGADPIALATTFMSNYTKNQINAFSVRIKAKTYGMGKNFYGEVNKGDNVILIDDVLTTGNSLRDTILICEKRGLIIKRIIVLVDRQEGGKEALENLGYNVQSVFTLRQLIS
jgi:orotate phosphoribosyltransferase